MLRTLTRCAAENAHSAAAAASAASTAASSASASAASVAATASLSSLPLFTRLRCRLTDKIPVGVDLSGNHYYIDYKTRSKRMVEYATGGIEGDSSTVPVGTWYAWLRYRRHEVPTIEECRQEAEEKIALAARVAKLKKEDEIARWQEKMDKQGSMPDKAIKDSAVDTGRQITNQAIPAAH